MKKIIGIIVVFSFSMSTAVFCQSTAGDSTFFQQRINHLDSSLSKMEKKYTQINDSLKNEIDAFQAREDYLSVSLEDQASRFSLIVTGLLALAALFSYGGYKYELSRMKKNVEKQMLDQTKEFKEYKNKIEKIDSSLRTSSANTFASIAMNFEKEQQYHLAFSYYITSTRDHAKSLLIDLSLNDDTNSENKDDKEVGEECKYIKANLNSANKMLTKIKTENSDSKKNYLTKEKSNINKDLKIIGEIDNEDIEDLLAELRISMKNYLKKSA